MAQPVRNICTPSNVYGGYNHTLFMGCSVMSFSASCGWNEQVSEVTVQLVEDPCTTPAERPKHYWDEDLNAQTTTTADPGFIGAKEMIGAPMYFRVGDFEFCGLLQDYEQHSAQGGRPTYTVKLVSPQLILEGVQLIVGEYAGATSSVTNLYNPFGFMESFGVACPATTFNGANFGTLAGGYGGSGRNDNGMSWNNIATGFNILCNATPSIIGTQWGGGRVTYRGYSYAATAALGGYGLIPGTQYFVDISELPTPPSYYRVEGPAVGLLESISQLCEESGYDYYLELLPVQDGALDATGIAKFLKFRTVSRAVAPTVGQISSFISNQATTLQSASADGLIDAAEGFELRNEVTSTFYFGGNHETVYQNYGAEPDCDHDDIILPYWGLDSDKNFIISCKDADGFWEFPMETAQLNAQLQVLSLPASVTISEKELMFAAAGFDEWESYEMLMVATNQGHDIGEALAAELDAWAGGIHNFAPILAHIAGVPGAIKPRDLKNTRKNNIDAAIDGNDGKVLADVDKIFEWVNNFATEFYGKKYAVRVPYTCAQVDDESALVTTSEVPQTAGWTDQSSILALPTDSLPMQFFRGDDGKYQSFCSFGIDGKVIGWANLDESSYGIYNNILYVKSSIEGEDWVYGDFANRLYPRAVVNLAQAIKYPSFDEIDDNHEKPENVRGLRVLLNWIANVDNTTFEGFAKGPGSILMNTVLPYKAYDPDGASFGVKSNIHVYGPWGSAGPAGKVRVVHDSGLTPWNFNGTTAMNTAGNALAAEGVTNMQYGEKGRAQVPGYPDIPLGSELGALAGGFFGAGTNLIENRTASSDNWTGDHVDSGSTTYYWGYFGYSGTWTGLYGPNVTGITVDVGPGGITTSYSFSTFTPKFGRFVKHNADRLRQIGRGKLRAQKNLAAIFLNQARLQVKAAQKADRRRRMIEAKKQVASTPAEVLIADITQYNKGGSPGGEELYRTIATLESMVDAGVTTTRGDYDRKAVMSMDGLIRPVSMDGDGGLPRYGNFTRNCDDIQSQGAIPPIYKGNAACDKLTGPWYGGDGNEWNQIHQNYLNPFSNPAGFSRSTVVEYKSDETTIGHDVDIIGRGSEPPDSGLPMLWWSGWEGTNHADYANDYRMFALKGPVLIQQWGYDLDGKPIPNTKDTEAAASGGTFTTSNLEYKFLDGWMAKPHTWPVGPLDLRWDRERGVWTAPPERRRILVELCEELCPNSSVEAKLVNGRFPSNLTDKDGVAIDTPVITVSELHNNCYKSGEKVTVYWDPYNCDYRVLEGHAPVLESTTGCIETDGNVNGPFHTLKAGLGLLAQSGENCCEVELCAGIWIEKTGDDCINGGTTYTSQFINDIMLGGGLTAQNDGPCQSTLQAGLHFYCDSGTITNCNVTETDYKFDVYLDDSHFYAEDVGDCGVKISVKEDVPASVYVDGDEDNVVRFNFDATDFDVTISGQVATVELAGGAGSRFDSLERDGNKMVGKRVPFVRGIKMNGNEVLPIMGHMEFSPNGRLLGVINE